jgi:prepilin-type N-terminal cleavage/methylation domain-containing protein
MTKLNHDKEKSGFTLMELLIVIAIIAVLISIAIPVISTQLQKARAATDQANARILNSVSISYGIDHETLERDIFENFTTDSERLNALVEAGYLDEIPSIQESGKKFSWSIEKQLWFVNDSEYVLKISDITFGSGWLKTAILNYTGDENDIVIPATINSTSIAQIYQDAFKNKGLTSLSFSEDSTVTRIHARAFAGNSLTNVSLPNTLTRIDYGAFSDNPDLNTVVIGGNVITIEGNAFKGGDSLKNLYFSSMGGSGVYTYENGTWVKK